MKMKLVRNKGTIGFTEGKLYIDGVFECYTVEDQIRDVKVQGETAIPAGTYTVIMNMSQRFGIVMPLIENVPGFTGVRIHSGNSSKDTEGCIIVGAVNDRNDDDWVSGSIVARDRLYAKLNKAFDAKEEITLEVV
jgi:hypothetical protein